MRKPSPSKQERSAAFWVAAGAANLAFAGVIAAGYVLVVIASLITDGPRATWDEIRKPWMVPT